jgi:KUP system potassium uptake protein
LGALGVVFGDIGTSPLYAFKESLHATGHGKATPDDILGLISLIIWSLLAVVSLKYLTFIMKASNRGEGGIFALLALVPENLRKAVPGRISVVAFLALFGAALLYGDGMITPAISVLSAVEGLELANPGIHPYIVPITCGILAVLFIIQRFGTGVVGNLFGPVMLAWFGTIGGLGIYHLLQNPGVLEAVSPLHAVHFFTRHGAHAIHVLASVVLAITGGEALYADMGHFGERPIRAVWYAVVLPALMLSYMGQAAHLLIHPETAGNPFFSQVPSGWATYALVILATGATIIASQALISGAFSMTRQAMQLGYFPRVRILHTAHHTEGQIYIPQINFLLAAGCLILVGAFGSSTRLAAAYGIAVTGTMVITSILFFVVSHQLWAWPLWRASAVAALFLAFDIPFFWANLAKFHDGGYVPVLIAALMLGLMLLWNRGRTLLAQRYAMRVPSPEFARQRLKERLATRVPGTAVFMCSNNASLPPVLIRHVDRSRALQETIILLTVQVTDEPTVPEDRRFAVKQLEDGFWRVVLSFGFMEEPAVPAPLERAAQQHGIPLESGEVTYYLGRETFRATSKGQMGAWEESLFAFLQLNSLSADRYFELPYRHVVELGTQVDL